MKILGMGVPELLILLFVLCVIAVPVAIVVIVVQRSKQHVAVPDPAQQASTAAYQRLAQLDDLRKRGAISPEEFEAKKQEIMPDL